MPHIIVEHSAGMGTQVDMPQVLKGLVEVLAGCGVDLTRIKARSYEMGHHVVADRGAVPQVHVTLLLLDGRDVATRKSYGDALHAFVTSDIVEKVDGCVMTLEVREMDRETYYL